jgi:hypothetical protein
MVGSPQPLPVGQLAGRSGVSSRSSRAWRRLQRYPYNEYGMSLSEDGYDNYP